MINLEQFKMYCAELGIHDAYCMQTRDSFVCMSTAVRMTSFLASKFTQWSDSFDSNGNATGYVLRLSKKDVHNELITGKYFPKQQRTVYEFIPENESDENNEQQNEERNMRQKH